MAKICEVGSARIGIESYLVANKVIDSDNRILSNPLLYQYHRTLKESFKNRFGLDREIIYEDLGSDFVQFNSDALHEIDALFGIKYPDNRKYWRNYNDDRTLTPDQMVSKYVRVANNKAGIEVKKAADFTEEEVNKLLIGIKNIYPEVVAVAEPRFNDRGLQRYSVAITMQNPLQPMAKPDSSPLMPDQDYYIKDRKVVLDLMEPLLKKMKNVSVEWISPSEMDQKTLYEFGKKKLLVRGGKVAAVAYKNKVYLVDGRVNGKVALEELMHIFIDYLNSNRPTLYKGLLQQALTEYPSLATQVAIEYSDENGFNKEYRDVEIVTRALRDAYIRERIERPEGRTKSEFLKIAERFFKWLTDLLAEVFGIQNIPLDTTIDQLAVFLNVSELELPDASTLEPRYNIESASDEDFDMYDEDLLSDDVADATSRDPKQVKLENYEDQLHNLKKYALTKAQRKFGRNSEAVKTIKKLIDVTNDLIEKLKNNEKTVSATKFIGQPDIPKEKVLDVNPAQDYGKFIHLYLQEIQLIALNSKEDRTPASIHVENPELFDTLYEDYESWISLPGLTKEIVRKDLTNIVSSINNYYLEGSIVVPEISIYGTDNTGKTIIGRLDFIVINPDGSVKVGDFKTTKLNTPTNVYKDYTLRKTYRNKKLLPGVHPSFQLLSNRSKVGTFMSQLGVYDRSLKQHGIESSDNVIVNIVYSPKPSQEEDPEWEYNNMFVAVLPIDGDAGLGMDRDVNGKLIGTVAPFYNQVLRALHKSIPVEGEDTFEKAQQNAENKIQNAIKKLDQGSVDVLLTNIRQRLETQLKEINKEYNIAEEKRADASKLEQLKQRRKIINEAKIQFDSAVTIEDHAKLAIILDKVFQLINTTVQDAQTIGKQKAETDIEKKNKLEKLSIKNQQLTDLASFLTTFRSIVLDANIAESRYVVDMIDKHIADIEEGQAPFLRAGEEKLVDILRSVPKKNADMMLQSMEQLLQGRKQKLERIIAGDASIFNKIGFWLGGKVNRVINSIGGVQTVKTITNEMKEAAQQELDKMKMFLNKPEYTEEFIRMYIRNTFSNPESNFYIGSTITSGYGGLSVDEFRSSFGNSELAITAIANYGISMTDAGQQKFWDQMEKLQIDQKIQTLSNRYGGYDRLNSMLSEIISIKNMETGEIENFMSFISPIAQTYKDEFDKLDYNIYTVNKSIDALKKDATIPEDTKKEKLKALFVEKTQARKKLQDFILKEAVPKMKPEVYNLEVQLPDDIQEKIEEYEKKISELRSKSTVGDWALQDSILTDIKKLEFDISQLRKKAKEEDPNIVETYKKLDQFYGYTVNQGLWDYIERSMIAQYGADSPEVNRWYQTDSEIVPSDAWYEARNKIFEKLNELNEKDPLIEDLQNERERLISKYRFKSRYSAKSLFVAEYMEDEDAAKLDAIEEEIFQYYENRPKTKKGKEVRELMEKLNTLQQEEHKPQFDMEFDEYREKLETLIEQINIAQDATTKTRATNDYIAVELDFKKWYDRNNTSTYELGSFEQGNIPAKLPKRFNIRKVPTDSSMMIRVPSAKYSMRHYKEEAYNPEYSPTLEKRKYGKGSYPSPKGIKYVKETGRFSVDPKATYVNPSYLAIMKDPTLKEFYESMVLDNYYNLQINMSASKLGFFFPAVRQSGFDSVAKDGIKGLRREWNEQMDNIMYKRSMNEQATNEFGIAGTYRVRFPSNYAPPGKPSLPESIVTKDGLNAIIKWRLQYEINQKMEEANLAMSPAIDFLKAKLKSIPETRADVREQVSKVIQIFEFERNKFIYGQQFTSKETENEFFNKRTLRKFLTAASWARMAFEPAMQVGNLVSGNVQAFLANDMVKYKQGRGTYKDYLWAKGQIYALNGFMHKLIENWGEISGVNLETKILRYFNPTMRDVDRTLDVTSRGKMRRLMNRAFNIQDIAYVIQDKGEIEIGVTTLLKNLKAHKFYVYELDSSGAVKTDKEGNLVFKLDENGEKMMVSAIEALYDDGSGIPAIRKDVAMSYEDLDAIKASVQEEYKSHQGNYSSWTQAPAEAGFIGILLFFFRKYLIPALELRFKGTFGIGDPKNWIAGEAQIGWWTAVGRVLGQYGPKQLLKSMLPGFAVQGLGGSEIPMLLRNKLFKARNEFMMSFMALYLYVQLRDMVYSDDDDDDDKLNWAQMQAMRSLSKVTNESRSLVPIPISGNLEDYIKTFATFTTAFNEFQTYSTALEHGLYLGMYNMTDSDYFYEMSHYMRRSGRYDKGDVKLTKDFMKIAGIENIQDIFDPQFALKEQYKKKD